MVERTGFEPVKPLGRQFYRLLRLATPAPLQSERQLFSQPEEGFEPINLPITSRLRFHCATRALNSKPGKFNGNLRIIGMIEAKVKLSFPKRSLSIGDIIARGLLEKIAGGEAGEEAAQVSLPGNAGYKAGNRPESEED
jgi:hypothetical protein